MPFFVDQVGNKITLDKTPQRIISLVPSQTELLHDLGLTDEVIGITKFCVHPKKWFQTKIRVGGTKQLKIDLIRQLKPDLIIANKEENVKEQIEELQKHFPAWTSDVNNLKDAYEMIERVGLMTNREEQALALITQIKTNFARLLSPGSRLPTAYLIWKDPYMTVGGDTFINSMLETAGFENVFKNKTRYPETTVKELLATGCRLLLLSSEPFPFKEKHVEEIKAQGFTGQIFLVDGEMFSWYGSRLLKAPEYFKKLQNLISSSSP